MNAKELCKKIEKFGGILVRTCGSYREYKLTKKRCSYRNIKEYIKTSRDFNLNLCLIYYVFIIHFF